MSVSTSSANGTTIVSGPDVIQTSDFYVSAGILHPIIVGSIAVIVLFAYLRLGSNRSVAPITVFDWIINVGLGSTLAGIVNGNSLVRGLLALATMLGFQFITSHLSTNFQRQFEWIFHAPPLVIVFRGEFLHKVMMKHRISESDVYSALRQQACLDVAEIEVVIIEANGTFSIFTKQCLKDSGREPKALMVVPAYKALCEESERKRAEKEDEEKRNSDSHSSDGRVADPMTISGKNRVALNNAQPNASWDVESALPV